MKWNKFPDIEPFPHHMLIILHETYPNDVATWNVVLVKWDKERQIFIDNDKDVEVKSVRYWGIIENYPDRYDNSTDHISADSKVYYYIVKCLRLLGETTGFSFLFYVYGKYLFKFFLYLVAFIK
jgi:hypothetical protein